MKKIMRLFLAFAIVPLLGSVSACSSPAAADAGTRTQDATSTTPDVAGQTAGENTGTGGVTTGGATAQGGSGGPMDASPTGGSSAPITTGRGDNRLRFDSGWRFHLGDVEGAEQPGFADTSWRELDLPHDWSIENPFDKSSPSGVGGGALAGGIGWYRKTFTLPPGAAGKQVLIWFDGVYMNSTVWVNGQSLGDHPYGYTSFFYDVTPALNATGSNVVAVKVNHRQPSSRWYSGSGIYRHVWLSFVDPVHFKPWGIFIFTRWVQGGFATVGAHVFVQNQTAVSQTVSVNMTVADDTGKVVSLLSQSASVEAGSESKLVFTGTVYQPRLWTLDQPVLYTATTELQLGDAIIETQKTPFGIRTFTFDAQQGFSLNGQAMKLHGLCMHHDLGALGAAINSLLPGHGTFA